MASAGEELGKAQKAEQEFWEKTRNDFLAGISERIRSMSLGTLVLIWGLLTGEHSILGPNVLSKNSKIELLAIALCSVIVLALDLLEYSSGYQASRQRVGENVRPDIDYAILRRGALLCKQVLSFLTLIGFIFVLGSILCGLVVNAAGADEMAQYYGRWCRGDRGTEKATLLVIGATNGRNFVTYNDQNDCSPPSPRGGYVLFNCGEYHFAASKSGGKLNLSSWKRDGQWSEHNGETKQLYDCKR